MGQVMVGEDVVNTANSPKAAGRDTLAITVLSVPLAQKSTVADTV